NDSCPAVCCSAWFGAPPRTHLPVFLSASPAGALARRGLFGRFLYLWRLHEFVAFEDELLDLAPALHFRRVEDDAAFIPGVRLEARVIFKERRCVVRLEPKRDLADAMLCTAGREELATHVECGLPEVIAFAGVGQ